MGPDQTTLAVAAASCQCGDRHAGRPAEGRAPPPVGGGADGDGAQSSRSTGSSRKAAPGIPFTAVLVVGLVVGVVIGPVGDVVVVAGVAGVVVVDGTAPFLVDGTHSSRRWISSGCAGPNWSLVKVCTVPKAEFFVL